MVECACGTSHGRPAILQLAAFERREMAVETVLFETGGAVEGSMNPPVVESTFEQ